MDMSSMLFSAYGSPTPVPCPSSLSVHNVRRLPLAGRWAAPPRRRTVSATARHDDGHAGDYGGRLVDEDMIVLRRRLQELEMAERGDETEQSHWAEWEKQYYDGSYGTHVCDVVAGIQRLLMDSRPAVVLAVVVLVAVSLSTTAAAVVFNLTAAISGVFHLS